MRALLLALALAVALKIWVSDSTYRSATEKALIAAYRERAVEACQSEAPRSADKAPLGLAVDWSRRTTAAVSIGNSAVNVYVWELENERWNDRFRKAFLILHATEASLSCAYDMEAGTASISGP